MINTVKTSDIYEAVYYNLNGCELKSIEGFPANKQITCKLTFEGENVDSLQIDYFHGKALVNLLEFRRAYNLISGWIVSAKRKFKKELMEGVPNEK